MAILQAIGLGLQIAGHKKSKRAEKRLRKEKEAAAKRAAERARKSAEFEAVQLAGKSKDELAIGSYRIEDQVREGKRVESSARAIGAASGAGGYEDTLSDIEAETEYRALTALHNSKQSARDLNIAAKVARMQGEDRAQSYLEGARDPGDDGSNLYALGGILSSAQSLYDRFGRGHNPDAGST